jgi:DNA (cytosine-5)-methyltransferase 1
MTKTSSSITDFSFGSMFTGIGGFDLANERAGMTCAWQAENDPKASAILSRHWPNITNHGDVRNVKKESAKSVNLICGGFPCQDVSVAGKRAGLAGKRSGLWFEFARIIDEFEPGWVEVENVPGLLSSNEGRDFDTTVQWLAKRGYGVAWRILDAQYFGLAQRRRRVFIVGHLGDGRAAEVLFESEGGNRNNPKIQKEGKAIAGAIKGSSGNSGRAASEDTALIFQQNARNELDFLIMAHGQGNAEIDENVSPTLNDNHEAPILFSDISPALEANDGDKWGSDQWIKKNPMITTWTERNGKGQGGKGYLESHKHAMAVSGQHQYTGVRRLTPTECERLQGFPPGWTDGQPDSPRYRQLGNAVAVPVVEWIAKRIMKVEASIPSRK